MPVDPSARRARPRRLEDLEGETLLLLEDGHCLRDQALEVCSRIRVNEEQDYRATSLETLRQMVAAGHGITLLPELAAATPVGTARGLQHQALCQARAGAHDRRGLAQVHHPRHGDRGGGRDRARRHEGGIEEMKPRLAHRLAVLALGLSPSARGPATRPWSPMPGRAPRRPAPTVGAAYLVIQGGQQADRLVGASSDRAAMVHLHTVEEQDGVAKMRGIDAVEVPAGQRVTLAPKSTHLMLMGLDGPLVAGQSFVVKLKFATAGAVGHRHRETGDRRPLAAPALGGRRREAR